MIVVMMMMNGVINVLKPPGMTSHDVVQLIRNLAGQRRVGHTGTLDPGAAGVLVVCLGKATKIIQYMNHDKQYRAELIFGKATTSQDSFGEVIDEADCSPLTIDDIRRGLEGFLGDTKQIPPMTSAVKHKGKKLYELARLGQSIERKPRRIKVYSINMVDVCELGTPSPRIVFDISCSAGTYIRTICADLGQGLGYCAYMSFLLRTAVGVLKIDRTLTLEELQERKQKNSFHQALLPMDKVLNHLPVVLVPVNSIKPVLNGNRVWGLLKGNHLLEPGQMDSGQIVQIQGLDGILAVGKVLTGTIIENNIEVQPVRVLV